MDYCTYDLIVYGDVHLILTLFHLHSTLLFFLSSSSPSLPLSLSLCLPVTRQAEDELRRMENVRNQRLDMLQRRDKHTYDTILWLRENQHLFRQPILEPVAVTVNIKDPRYAPQVEAFLGGKDFYSFVAQNEEDREKFLREVKNVVTFYAFYNYYM